MEFKNVFSWSKSRDSIFKECPRKYYFNYYGYWNGWDKNAPDFTKRINYLKKLETKEIWMGKAVHEVVEYVLRKFRDGEKIGMNHAIAIFRKRMYSEFEQSKAKIYTGFYSKIPKLFEHEYELFFTAVDLEDLLSRGERCIENFFNSDVFLKIKNTPLGDWIFLEDFLSFDFYSVPVYLSIDFALRDGNKIILYDWKTGRERTDDFDLQLVLYSLFVSEKFNISPDNIRAKVFNLNIDKEDEFVINSEKTDKIKDYVKDSIFDMREKLVNVAENIAKKEDFGREEGYWCARCNFRKVCLGEWAQ